MTITVNRNLSNCEKARKKDFGTSTGFEPVASALALQCSTSLSGFSQLLKLRFTAMVISFVFPQFTSFHYGFVHIVFRFMHVATPKGGLLAAVTPGLLTIVKTGITIVSYFGNVTANYS